MKIFIMIRNGSFAYLNVCIFFFKMKTTRNILKYMNEIVDIFTEKNIQLNKPVKFILIPMLKPWEKLGITK